MASASSAQAVPLSELASQAGAGPIITEYLEARGIVTSPTLALIATDRESFVAQVVRPLMDGFKKGTREFSLAEDEKPIAAAVLEHMWSEAALQWQQRQAMLLATTTGQFHAVGTPPVAPASATASATDKAPKQLPAHVWQKQITRYNTITVDGRPRKFPEKEVLGAESILGRMWFEHTSSKTYTPVGLGEILQRRSFTAAGEVNPLQKQSKTSQVLRLEDDQIVQGDENRTWTPRSVLSVLDGINSVRWAWILLQLGEEDHVHTFADWFTQKVRSRPNKLEHIRLFWDAAGWKMALGMRAGRSFGDVSTEVMADVDLFNDAMTRDIPKETKPVTTKKRAAGDDQGPPYKQPRTTTWGHGQGSKGTKGNQKGRPGGFNQYGNSQRWRHGNWSQQNQTDSTGGHDPAHRS